MYYELIAIVRSAGIEVGPKQIFQARKLALVFDNEQLDPDMYTRDEIAGMLV